MRKIGIGERLVGNGERVFIIAEVGVNHDGDVALAKRLVDEAADAGADAVKFQTFRAERLASATAAKASYQLRTTDRAESQLEMLRRLELSPDAHREVQRQCMKRAIAFVSTPFDEGSADLLEELDVPVFKIGSGEITNWSFLEYVARKGKPIILSTGMSFLSEVDEAVRIIRRAGCEQLVLLHCVSSYPADPADANLLAMQTMATAFGVPVGFSDHTRGIEVSLAAVALGASVIEKHFTLDRNMPGPDHQASLEPEELVALVRGIRTVERSLGDGRKKPALAEAEAAAASRRSLVATRDIPAGVLLTEELIGVRRPGTGLPPAMRSYLLGRRTRMGIPAGALFELEMLL